LAVGKGFLFLSVKHEMSNEATGAFVEVVTAVLIKFSFSYF
jgi:hypothetical protein